MYQRTLLVNQVWIFIGNSENIIRITFTYVVLHDFEVAFSKYKTIQFDLLNLINIILNNQLSLEIIY